MSSARAREREGGIKTIIKRLAVRLPWGWRKIVAFTALHGAINLLWGRPSFVGTYQSFSDAPPSNAQDAQYLVDAADRNLRSLKLDGASGSPALSNSHSLFTLAAALLAGPKPLRILDVGGAAGVDFANLLKAAPNLSNIQYCVIDVPAVCAFGAQRWKNDKRISFSDRMPSDGDQFDLIYSSWAIQYFAKPLELLKKCAGYGAPAILLLNVPFTMKSAFVRVQVNRMLPSWVLSVPEVERLMSDSGYRIAFHATANVDHNVDNYPRDYRVPNVSNILFLKS